MYILHEGDCLEQLKNIESNSIDSIVTDPPYELTSKHGARTHAYGEGGKKNRGETVGGFMGMKWDATGIAHNVELWQECLRVLKPGGHLLAFGGSRTYHRMAVAIEDSGFEIRDTIMWLYGSGFPKSMDISKQIDKQLGAEREIIGKDETWIKRVGQNHSIDNENYTDKCFGSVGPNGGNITAPATPEAKEWENITIPIVVVTMTLVAQAAFFIVRKQVRKNVERTTIILR